MIGASSSSSNDDMSLGTDQEEAPVSTYDATFSSLVPQHRGGVPSQRGQFSRKYEAHWNDDL
jgi:hypothetical protein